MGNVFVENVFHAKVYYSIFFKTEAQRSFHIHKSFQLCLFRRGGYGTFASLKIILRFFF